MEFDRNMDFSFYHFSSVSANPELPKKIKARNQWGGRQTEREREGEIERDLHRKSSGITQEKDAGLIKSTTTKITKLVCKMYGGELYYNNMVNVGKQLLAKEFDAVNYEDCKFLQALTYEQNKLVQVNFVQWILHMAYVSSTCLRCCNPLGNSNFSKLNSLSATVYEWSCVYKHQHCSRLVIPRLGNKQQGNQLLNQNSWPSDSCNIILVSYLQLTLVFVHYFGHSCQSIIYSFQLCQFQCSNFANVSFTSCHLNQRRTNSQPVKSHVIR